MHGLQFNARRLLAVLALVILVLPAGGCVGMTAQLLYLIRGNKVEADFNGLVGKRVAVVCVSSTSSFGPGTESVMVAQTVGNILRQKVKKIEVVRNDEVANWIDNNNWDQIDFRTVGRGVNADMVVAIELEGVRLTEGPTLYRGRAAVTLTAYDMKEGGKIAYRREPFDFAFPVNGARHSTEISEASFRRQFVHTLAEQIAKRFYAYEAIEDVAMDSTFIR
jgi:hypothetical protein